MAEGVKGAKGALVRGTGTGEDEGREPELVR